MIDDNRPPTLRERLLHPYAIAGILLVVVFGGFWLWGAVARWQRAALDETLAPLESEWDEIRLAARPRLAEIEAVLAAAASPTTKPCGSIAGPVEVVHRPILRALATGTRFPRDEAPSWLSSQGYAYSSEASTPARNLAAMQRRNDRVRAMLDHACVVVLDTDVASAVEVQPDRAFEGGEVSGWATIVCRQPEPRGVSGPRAESAFARGRGRAARPTRAGQREHDGGERCGPRQVLERDGRSVGGDRTGADAGATRPMSGCAVWRFTRGGSLRPRHMRLRGGLR